MRALILAGGAGMRLRPLTLTRPKPLTPFLVAPFASGLLTRLRDAGVTVATFLVAEDASPFSPLVPLGAGIGLEVEVETEEKPLDTAGAARRALTRPGVLRGQPVLVCNGDILTDLNYSALVAWHRAGGAMATVALTRVDDPSTFGVAVVGEHDRIERFVEKPAPGTAPADTVNAGTYVLTPEVFDQHPGDGPLSFEREVFPGLVARGALAGATSSAFWADVGTPPRYRAGQRAVLEGRCEWPVPEGVILDEAPSARHVQATVAEDAVVEAGTVIGIGCQVASRARLSGAVLFDHVAIGPGAQVREAVLGEGVRIGADAVVEEDAVVGDGALVRDRARVPSGARVEPLATVTESGVSDVRGDTPRG